MVDNEHLKCTATLPLYITLESTISRTHFSRAFATLILWNSHFWVSMLYCSWRPFNWCINYQCRTDIHKAKVISDRQHKSKFNFDFFYIQIFGFPCFSTHKDLSIDVTITNVGLILTKLWWIQLFVTSQNLNFELPWRKFKFWVSMV